METQEVEDRLFDALTENEYTEPPEAVQEPAEDPVEDEVEAQEDEAVEEPVEADSENTVEIEIDGETLEVPEKYKDYFLRQQDYTQKTQSLAEQRKQVELQQQHIEVAQKETQFIRDIQPELNNIGYLDAQIHQINEDLRNNLSNLSSEQLFKKKIEMDGLKEQRDALKKGLETKYMEFEEEQKQSYQELLEKNAQAIKKAIPGWGPELQAKLRDFAISRGYSQHEISGFVEVRRVEEIWGLMQLKELQGKAKPAALKAQTAIKAKGRPNKMDDAAKNRLAQNKIRKTKGLSNAEKADRLLDTKLDAFM